MMWDVLAGAGVLLWVGQGHLHGSDPWAQKQAGASPALFGNTCP